MSESVSVRRVRKGDIIRTRDGEHEEVVRAVNVVLELSNGSNEVYASTEEIEIIPQETIDE